MDASQTANAAGHPPPVAAAPGQGTLPMAPAAVEQQEPPTAGKKRSKLRSWDEMYQCLLRYKEENNGSVAVPRQYPPDKNLGEWVIKVRMFQRKLSPEQRKKLDKIGFSFESRLEGYERKWNEMFEELNKFKNENGHCIVPESQRSEKDGRGKLARWVHYQRKHQWKMSQDRQDKLNSIGFIWKRYPKQPGEKKKEPSTTKLDTKWMAHYVKLKAFHEEKGHCSLLQDHHDQPLYFWFKTQRTLMHQNLLRADRKEMMDKLNMIWDTKETLNSQWEEKFTHAMEYKKQHGTLNLPHRTEVHGLGNWIAYQKRCFREGLIEPGRARRLLDADMAYVAEKDYSWNDRLAKLKMVDSWRDLQRDPELDRWARLQLALLDCHKLSRDRRIILEAIRLDRLAAMPSGPLHKPRAKNPPASAVQPAAEPTPTTAQAAKTTSPETAAVATTVAPVALPLPAIADPQGAKQADAKAGEASTNGPTAGVAAGAATTTAAPPGAEPMIIDQPTTQPTDVGPTTAPAAATADGQATLATEPAAKPKRKRGRPRIHPIKVPTRKAKRTWDQSFDALAKYKEENGTAKLPSEYPEDAALLKWAKRQRTYKHSLTEEQLNKLESIGFTLEGHLEKKERTWEEKFVRLKQFIQQKGNSLVTLSDDKELRIWVGDQRKKYKYGTLRQDRMERLNTVGFVWNAEAPGAKNKADQLTNPKQNEIWQLQYDQLVAFHRLHGHCDVKSNDPDKKLHAWIKKQRDLRHKKRLPQDRIEKLNRLGLIWRHKEHTDQLAWNSKFELLVVYKEKEGHCDVPTTHKQWGLGGWCSTQRSVFRFGDMFPERARKLLELGFPLILEYEVSWKGRYKKLKELTTLDELWRDPHFERWVKLQKVLMKTNSLPSDRQQLLSDIKLLINDDDKDNGAGGALKEAAQAEEIDTAEAGPIQETVVEDADPSAHKKDSNVHEYVNTYAV